MIFYVSGRIKRPIFDEYLEFWGRPLADRITVVEWEELTTLRTVPRGSWVLADLDAHGPAGRALATALHDALATEGLPVLNDPHRTLGRLELLRALHEAGINDFRVVPAHQDWTDLDYPVFVRGASDHFGARSGLLESPREVQAFLDRNAAAGLPADDLIVVEFLDTSDDDGVFRKFGSYVVGDRIIPQHVLWSDQWMIKHRRGLFTPETAREELRLVRENPHEEQLREIFVLAGTEYGRVDYSVGADGRPQVWEINLCPIVGRGRRPPSGTVPEELRPLRRPRKELFYDRFREAWEAVDSPGPAGPEIELDVPDAVRRAAREELAPAGAAEGFVNLLRAKTFFRHW